MALCYGCGKGGATKLTSHPQNGTHYWHNKCYADHVAWLTGGSKKAKNGKSPFSVEVGGVTVLLNNLDDAFFASDMYDDLLDTLHNLPEVKEVEGPLINGIIAITFSSPSPREYAYYIEMVKACYDRFMEGV